MNDLPRVGDGQALPQPQDLLQILLTAFGQLWWLFLLIFAVFVVQTMLTMKFAKKQRQARKDDITEAVAKALEEDRKRR